MTPLSRRLGALAASSALAATLVTTVSAPAQAAGTDPRPVEIGADWLAGELTGGLLTGDFDAKLYGASIDAALSLKAAGGHTADVEAIGAAIATDVKQYVEYAYDYDSSFPADGIDEHFEGQAAGQTAKALVLGQALSTPTTTMDGIDLLARLEGFVATTSPIAGRLVGVSTKDGVDDPASEYTNVVGQALGTAALHAAGSAKTADVVAFLLQQQCSAGYFRVDFTYDKTASDQTCDGGDEFSSAPDPDATSQVIRLLAPQAAGSATIEAALADAEAWLTSRQRPDGSFTGGTGTEIPNANSTALAGLALAARGNLSAATKAAIWVRRHQVDEPAGCPNALSGETGAIAYDAAALAAGRASGIGSAAQQWRIAASQALPVLAYAPAATPALKLTGPSGYVKGGSTVSYTATGIVPGDKLCVVALGTTRTTSAGAAGTALVRLTMPSTTGKRTVTVRDRDGSSSSVVTSVLGKKTLTVEAPSSARRGTVVRVVVRGLAPAERVRVAFRGITVRRGYAGPSGTFVAEFKVGSTLGSGNVQAFGQFEDTRKGYDILRVVS